MAGRQAKVITPGMLRRMLGYVRRSRYPRRNRVIVLLGIKAGLRACEIAGLEWSMVLDGQGSIDPPPLKWSALRYGFRAKEDHDAEEETQARGDCCEAAPGGCAGVASSRPSTWPAPQPRPAPPAMLPVAPRPNLN